MTANRTSEKPLLVGPANEIYDDGNTLTMNLEPEALKAEDALKAFYNTFKLQWMYAISPTKYRLKSSLDPVTLVGEIKKANAFATTILSMVTDQGTVFNLTESADLLVAQAPLLNPAPQLDEKKHAAKESGDSLGISVRNLPVDISSLTIHEALKTIWDGMPHFHLEPDGFDSMTTTFRVPNKDVADLFLSQPLLVMHHLWTFHPCELAQMSEGTVGVGSPKTSAKLDHALDPLMK